MKIVKNNSVFDSVKTNRIFCKLFKNQKVVKVSEICDIVRGGSPRPIKNYITNDNNETPWLKIKDATSVCKYIETTKEYIIKNGESYSRVVNPGDFIVSNSATPGIPRIMKIRACIHDGWLLLNDIKINKDYLFYLFNSIRDQLVNQGQGSIFKNLSKDILANFEIKIYENVKQQEKIASVLSMQEDQIERIKGLIEKIEKRNSYYAEKLLSGELRVRENAEIGNLEFYENEDWQDVVLNGKQCKIPVGWNVGLLGDENSKILSSGVKSFDGIKKYYATGDIDGRCGFNDTYKITNFESKDSRANMEPQIDTVWFAKMKDTEKQLIFTKDCNFEKINKIILSTGFCGIKVCKNLDVNYLFEFLCSKKFNDLKNNLSMGSTQKSINNGNIKKISYTYPNISDQINISKVLKSLNDELDKLKQLLPKEEKRFQWMLDNLLSGEYEIVD